MKKIVILLCIYFIATVNCMGCDLSKIDSVFTKHIKSLNDSIVKYANPDRKKIYIGIDNIMFLEMVTFISDIQFERHGYTLQPMINMEDLKIIKKWYRKNRKRLNWRKINDFFVLEKKMRHPPNFDIDEMEEYQEKLWIEMDLLHETNTFIDK